MTTDSEDTLPSSVNTPPKFDREEEQFYIPSGDSSVVSETTTTFTPVAHKDLPYTYVRREACGPYQAPSGTTRAADDLSSDLTLRLAQIVNWEEFKTTACIPKEIKFDPTHITRRKPRPKRPTNFKRFLKTFKPDFTYKYYCKENRKPLTAFNQAAWEHNTVHLFDIYEIPHHIYCMDLSFHPIHWHKKLASLAAKGKWPLRTAQV